MCKKYFLGQKIMGIMENGSESKNGNSLLFNYTLQSLKSSSVETVKISFEFFLDFL